MQKILIVIVFSALLLSACAPKLDEVVEKTVDMVQEMAPEGFEMADVTDSTHAESGDSGQEYVTWGFYNFPSQFPEYTDGRIQKPFSLQDWYPVVVGIEDTSVQAIEDYVQRAIDAGFELLWEREAQGDEDLGWAVSKSTDEEHYSVMLSYYEDFYGVPDWVNLVLDVREK